METTLNIGAKIPRFEDLIIFEDEHYLAISKPAYLSTLDERSTAGSMQSVVRMAKRYNSELQVCHRIDKETSGILLLSKHAEAYRHASIAFEKRVVDKTYHAIVHGAHYFEDVEVDYPILNKGNKNVILSKSHGKEARTIFNSLAVFQEFTLVECKPITGRMHQIRVHLASQKASIVNDSLYGGKPIYLSEIKKRGFSLGKDKVEQPLIKRFALHAKGLTFKGFGNTYVIEAEYPKDFSVLLKYLNKFNTR